jgi:putative SOS response-associated peptidase YedK
MCGRFTLATPASSLQKHFQLDTAPELPFRYNVAPTQNVTANRVDGSLRVLSLLRWGLIPHWADDPKSVTDSSTFAPIPSPRNLRSEPRSNNADA